LIPDIFIFDVKYAPLVTLLQRYVSMRKSDTR